MRLWRKQPALEDVETFRDWLSEEEWQQAVEQIRKRAMDFNGPERRDQDTRRHQAITRCLLRVERRGQVLGILLVRSRNLSRHGMCVVHGGRLPRRAQATIVIEADDGTGVITSGQVAWCKAVKGVRPVVHEIGLEFDEPIDVDRFVDARRSHISADPSIHAA